jgi:cytochrome c5
MTKDLAIKRVIAHFKNADRYNQLRPGETTLAIKCFIAGFQAMYSMTDSVKLTDKDFEAVIDALEDHFDQFTDSKTTTREVA